MKYLTKFQTLMRIRCCLDSAEFQDLITELGQKHIESTANSNNLSTLFLLIFNIVKHLFICTNRNKTIITFGASSVPDPDILRRIRIRILGPGSGSGSESLNQDPDPWIRTLGNKTQVFSMFLTFPRYQVASDFTKQLKLSFFFFCW